MVRIRGERWLVAGCRAGQRGSLLDVCGRDKTNFGRRASFVLPFEVVEPCASSHRPRGVRVRRWRRLTRTILADATPSWQSLRAARRANIALFPFQLEPALSVTAGLASRILLADEVGLGKTIQAGLIVAELLDRRPHGHVLVVAPASLKEQWRTELKDRFDIPAWIADAASLARLGSAWTDRSNPWQTHAVTITSIDYVKRLEVIRALEPLVWDAVVFDEAHAVAGRSDRSAAANALARRARTVVMATATPHTGDDDRFEGLCRTGALGSHCPLLAFRRTRLDVGLASRRRTKSIPVGLSLAEHEMHRALMAYSRRVWVESSSSPGGARLAMTVLVRRACSSAFSLARSVDRRLALLGTADVHAQFTLPWTDSHEDDEEPGAELMATGLGDPDVEHTHLRRIGEWARRAAQDESKLRVLARLLRRVTEPAIVFTEYRDTLTRLAEALKAYEPLTLHGGMSQAERHDSLRQFTTGQRRLLLATDAASEGLNLQRRCRLVINLELPWTPLRLEQRAGRVERIGQTRPVHVVHLLAGGTAEQSSVEVLLAKLARARRGLASLRPPASSEDIADAVIGERTIEDRRDADERAGSLLTSSLQAEAEREAQRLAQARSLDTQSAYGLDDRAPFVIVRRRWVARGSVFGFRLAFTDADEQLVWEAIIGVGTPLRPRARSTAALESTLTSLSPAVERARLRLFESVRSSRGTAIALARRREDALAGALTAERARLAAALLQPGLFDRRAERTSAAQMAVLDEAVAACRARVEELARSGSTVAGPYRLAFAVCRR
jgi:superfamily II DNA or RNA helicase